MKSYFVVYNYYGKNVPYSKNIEQNIKADNKIDAYQKAKSFCNQNEDEKSGYSVLLLEEK